MLTMSYIHPWVYVCRVVLSMSWSPYPLRPMFSVLVIIFSSIGALSCILCFFQNVQGAEQQPTHMGRHESYQQPYHSNQHQPMQPMQPMQHRAWPGQGHSGGRDGATDQLIPMQLMQEGEWPMDAAGGSGDFVTTMVRRAGTFFFTVSNGDQQQCKGCSIRRAATHTFNAMLSGKSVFYHMLTPLHQCLCLCPAVLNRSGFGVVSGEQT